MSEEKRFKVYKTDDLNKIVMDTNDGTVQDIWTVVKYLNADHDDLVRLIYENGRLKSENIRLKKKLDGKEMINKDEL